MKLNPLDIRRQEFARKTFGGYDQAEVDGFVKQLAEQWEVVLDETRAATDRIQELEGKLRHYERVEMALQEALESARESGRRAEALSEQKARLIIEEAELRARQILQDSERDRHSVRQDLVKLTSRQTEIGARLRGFLLSELEILAQFQGDDPVGFIKLQPAWPNGDAPQGAIDAAPEAPRLAAPVAATHADPAPAEAHASEMPAASEEPASETPAAETPAPAEPSLAEPALAEAPAAAVPDTTPSWMPEPGDPLPPFQAPSWNLRSLVTGEGDTVAGSEAERDRIRRILDDLD